MGYVTGFTSAAAAGGGNISQLYIEYFMKNPNKIKKEDKENIRNILKDEHFNDELVDFINLHLKL
jgi:predicted nucleic-acid-binding protein